MVAYYNDSDPFCCAWLRNLVAGGFIPGGYVDERDIRDVEPDDLRGFRQCHFFAGIGGWAYALQLAGWPSDRPVWTGSCPCQPFSSAGRQGGALDERHLWPRWFRLIGECRPDAILGEQVEGAVGFGWVDRVFADLEAEGYACGAAVLGAHSVGAPHIRQRLFWVADADGGNTPEWLQRGWEQRLHPQDGSDRGPAAIGERADGWLADADDRGAGRELSVAGHAGAPEWQAFGGCSASGALGNTRREGLERPQRSGDMELQGGAQPAGSVGQAGFWSSAIWLPCLDGKARRVEPQIQPLASGIPNRVGLLRGSGNAITPQTAALFIEAVMEVCR